MNVNTLKKIIRNLVGERVGKKMPWDYNQATAELREELRETNTWAKLSSKDDTLIVVRVKKYHKRENRILHLISPETGNEQPVTLQSVQREWDKLNNVRRDNLELKIKRALREIVEPQIQAYRVNRFRDIRRRFSEGITRNKEELRCPLSGERLIAGKIDVDHVYPFSKLCLDWLEKEGYESFREIPHRRFRDIVLLSKRDEKSWYDYHLKKAELRLTSAGANRSKGARSYG